MAQMIQQRTPRPPHAAADGPLARAGVARGQSAPGVTGWKEAGSETSSWERSTEGEAGAPSIGRQDADGGEELASGTPSERADGWCDDEERGTEESWYDGSEEDEEGEEGEEEEDEEEEDEEEDED